jgi:hypothetical protein
VVSSNPFLEKIQNTETFRGVTSFVLRTTIVSVLSSIFSLVLSSFEWKQEVVGLYERWAIITWFFLLILNLTYFMYCMHNFSILSKGVPKRPIRGG